MTIEKNDPRLTAFVLGELADDEAKEVQAALDADAELRTEVEAIRKTVAEIEDFMKTEPMPGETKISTPGVINQPKKIGWVQRLAEFSVVGIIVLVLISLFLPAVQAPREASRRMQEKNALKQMDAEVDGIPSATMPAATPVVESEPIADYRYSGGDEKRRERHEKLAEELMEAERSFIPVPEEASESSPVDRDRLSEAVNAKLPTEKSEKKDEAPVSGQPKSEPRLSSGSGPAKPASPPLQGNGIPFQREAERSSGKITVGLSNPGDITADLSIPAEQSSYGLSDPAHGGFMAGKEPGTQRSAVAGRPKREDVVRGLREYAPSPALGVPSTSVPVSPHFQGGYEERGSITMTVTPKVIVQEEEEEYLAGTPADPYNSASDEAYKNFVENDFLRPQKAPFSTFSIDVDTAAYTTMRRYINQGQRPPAVSVRLEEYVNFFKYDYAQPKDGKPFATHVDVAPCPWEPKHLLARIGIKGKEYTVDERPPLNLVFLIDTSGSMSSSNRLPLVQRGLTELVEMLQPKDRVAIVTYAGSSKLALPSVSGQEKQAILDSINSLNAGGSTAGAAGIKTAYETARKYYNKNAQNRVILCTDGDFNVGTTDNKTLEQMIGEEAKSGVFLTILGFGMGNYKDERLKTLSMRGNGNYGYVDTIEEARRLLVEGLTGTLFAIAKDVKIQVDFNPSRVAAYRLLGYENRKLRDEDFHNDKIDAGEIGAGHTVTALYEIVPVGAAVPSKVDESRYAEKPAAEKPGSSAGAAHPALEGELMFVKLRYKQPDGDKSSLLEYPVVYNADVELSGDAEFAAAVALYGMLLRQSRYSGAGSFDGVLELAEPNVKDDSYRKEFIELVRKAKELR